MRELIYLSEAKLRQFRPERKGKWRRVREVDAKAPLNLGGVKFSFPDEAAATVADLERVLRHLDVDSAQPPRWYTEDGLEPGQWVQFEAQLNYEVLSDAADGSDSSVLVFWDAPPPGGGRDRLLLHGSPGHLIGAAASGTFHDRFGRSTAHEFLRSLNHLLAEATSNDRSLRRITALMSTLDRFPAETASLMAGHARITAIMHRVVVASPLYVQYSR